MKLVNATALLVGKKGAHLGVADNDGRTALHYLAEPLYLPDPRTRDPLDSDLEDEHLGAVLAGQIKGGGSSSADVINHADNTGSTAPHIAARAASSTAVALLLRLGADPNLPDKEGCSTPLHLAAQLADWVRLGTYDPSEYAAWSRRAARIKKLLLGAGADATVRDAQGRTAAEVEEAVAQKLRRGREEYLEDEARPRPDYGRGRGRGAGWAFRAAPAQAPPVPATREDGGVDVSMSRGAGHGRGA
jgi:hypothetical protein